MKKVTVITLQNVRNYGSALQAFATQHVFESLNCKVDFVDYVRKDFESPFARWRTWCKGMGVLKSLLYALLLLPTFIKQNKIFIRFLRASINTHKGRYCTESDFKKYIIDSDIYCTGSDQTWNSDWNLGILPPLFLSFVPDNVKKISYAASIGKSKLDDFEINITKGYLEKYSSISVRESSAVDILKNQLDLPSVTQVLDPTLQVSRNFWTSILSNRQKNRKDKGEYVLIYQLNSNPQFDVYAKEFARRKGWKLIRLCTRYDQILKPGKAVLIPEVTEFVSLIYNAGCVVTDSFHAVAFCCNLNIPMIAIYPNEFSSRLANILKLFGLESRHLTDYEDFSFVENTSIDFSHVNEILTRERQIGLDFLKKAISD